VETSIPRSGPVAGDDADDIALGMAYIAHGMALSRQKSDAERKRGLTFLRKAREIHLRLRMLVTAAVGVPRIAEMLAEAGAVDRAIEDLRSVVDDLAENDERFMRIPATGVFVQLLLMRASSADIREAAIEMERFAAIEMDPGFVHKDIQLLRMRALLARAKGDDAAYRDYADRYLTMAKSVGFEGHMAIAERLRRT